MKHANANSHLGFNIAVMGTVITLLWIGLFKFTPTEAKAIQPLIKNSPLMSWLNSVWSVQGVSNFIGAFEIITALLLAGALFWNGLSRIAGILGTVIFLGTLSFLFTTPGMFKVVDGFFIAEGFLLKDIVMLGVCIQVFLNGRRKDSTTAVTF